MLFACLYHVSAHLRPSSPPAGCRETRTCIATVGKQDRDLSSSHIENPAKQTPRTASAQQVGEWHPKFRAGNATLSRLVRRQRADFVQVKTLWAG